MGFRGILTPQRPPPALGLLTPAPMNPGAGFLSGTQGETLTFARAGAKYVEIGGGVPVTNYISFSQEIGQPYWVKRGSTVTPNALVAPDGTRTGALVSGVGAPGSADLYAFAGSVVPAGPLALSFWIYPMSSSGFLGVEQSTADPGGWTISLAALPAGEWTRLTATHSAVTVDTAFSADGTNTDGPLFFTNSGPQSFGLWGVQLEVASAAGHYVKTAGAPTTDATSTVSAKLAASGAPAVGSKGLLIESAHTNALVQSQSLNSASWSKGGTGTVTADQARAPDGTLTADLLTGIGAPGDWVFQDSVPVTSSGDPFAPSFWLKKVSATGTIQIGNPQNQDLYGNASLDLSQLSTGWERISLVHPALTVVVPFVASANDWGGLYFAATAGAPLSFYVWGTQIEAGSYSHSYTPTTTAAVTAAADVASLPTTNLPVAAGSIELEFTPLWSSSGGSGGPADAVLFDSTAALTKGVSLDISFGNFVMFFGSSTLSGSGDPGWVAGQTYRIRLVWGGGVASAYRDGVLQKSGSVSMPTGHGDLYIGNYNGSQNFANGYISNLQVRAA